jgi:hypothetical protein
MNRRKGSVRVAALVILLLTSLASAQDAKNPKILIGDPELARLQQGRKELTEQEKKDLERTGFTGLELMTYVHANQLPGKKDTDYFRWVRWTELGIVQTQLNALRAKYYFEDYKTLLGRKKIKPGDVEVKWLGFMLLPQAVSGDAFVVSELNRSAKDFRARLAQIRPFRLKRVRSVTPAEKNVTFFGSLATHDDWNVREPWEEEHTIIGEDSIQGRSCFVVESKNWLDKSPYYSRRVTWVKKETFVDLHEEQFDPNGKIFKVMDKEWELHLSGYWLNTRWIVADPATGNQSLEERLEWLIDQGLTDADFSTRALEREEPWRRSTISPPPIERISDFPPAPEVRWTFWEKKGERPKVVGRK